MEKDFSPQQSLQLIQVMIEKARLDISYNRFYFLFWGWLAFGCIVVQFLLKVVIHSEYHYLVWLLMFPALFVNFFHAKHRTGKRQARSYVADSMKFLWIGLGISFFVTSFIISHSSQGFFYAYPFFILLYGLGTFVSGNILKFKPLIYGGIFNWLLACVSCYFHFDGQMLFAAAALLSSYIIPGHLLPAKKNL